MPRKDSSTPVQTRIDRKYTVNLETGCHEWTGAMSTQAGYPTVMVNSKNDIRYVYHLTWEALNGPIPEGPCPDGSHRYELHHRCENKACINAHHVQLLTSRQHQEIHGVRRRQIKDEHAISHAPWIIALLNGGFSLDRIKRITNTPFTYIRAIAKGAGVRIAEAA